MATLLNKLVIREIPEWDGPSKDAKRPLVVTLNPAGFVSFRLKGLHQDYDLGFGHAYAVAVREFADKAMANRRREKEIKRRGLA